MKILRSLFFVAVLCASFAISTLFSATVSAKKYSQDFPAVACIPSTSGATSFVSIGSRKTPYRKIGGKATVLSPINTTRFSSTHDPILLDSKDVTTVAWQSLSGIWAGASICQSPQGRQWFVGGRADVTSKGRILLVNSGLSEAIADVATWSESGKAADKVISVAPNSFQQVRLDSLAAGSKSITVRITPRSGRLISFMVDERGKGLRALGGDIVNSAPSASKDFIISGILHQILNGKSASHTLRLLTPGKIDANVHVDLISRDGTFSPVGLDQRTLASGVVTDILMDPKIISKFFSLRITSDQRVVAGVYTSMMVSRHQDFIWNSATPELTPMTLALSGLDPQFIFTGAAINVKIEAIISRSASKNFTVVGSEILSWKPPTGTTSVKFTSVSPGIYGVAVVKSDSGVAAFPIVAGSSMRRAAIPSPNILVINR